MSTIAEISLQLQQHTISLGEWQAQMMEVIRDLHTTAAAAAAGGWGNMTQADWGYVGSLIKKQYDYLRNFAADIESGKQRLDGTFLVRANLYEQAARGTYEQMMRRFMSLRGFSDERRVLGEADHCDGCLEQAGLQWQPIGTLDPIGAEECVTHCRCHYEYRRLNVDGSYSYEGRE